jgi:hypothetical protein
LAGGLQGWESRVGSRISSPRSWPVCSLSTLICGP